MTDGQDKLQPGTKVEIRGSTGPADKTVLDKTAVLGKATAKRNRQHGAQPQKAAHGAVSSI